MSLRGLPWNDFEKALLMSQYPSMYAHSRHESATWEWIAERMHEEIDRRGFERRRTFNNVNLRRYMSMHRADLIGVWGEDGVKATRYIRAFDGILAVMNASGSVTSQNEVIGSFSIEDLVNAQLVAEQVPQQ